MSDDDLRLQFYNSARAELIARVGFRDTALIAYVVTIGGYFGFMLSQHFQNVPAKLDITFAPRPTDLDHYLLDFRSSAGVFDFNRQNIVA